MPSITAASQDVQKPNTEDKPLFSPAQKRFQASELCYEARKQLQALDSNPKYNTDCSRFKQRPFNFVDRHLYYLSMHPNTSLDGYISNLKLMTKIEQRI